MSHARSDHYSSKPYRKQERSSLKPFRLTKEATMVTLRLSTLALRCKQRCKTKQQRVPWHSNCKMTSSGRYHAKLSDLDNRHRLTHMRLTRKFPMQFGIQAHRRSPFRQPTTKLLSPSCSQLSATPSMSSIKVFSSLTAELLKTLFLFLSCLTTTG